MDDLAIARGGFLAEAGVAFNEKHIAAVRGARIGQGEPDEAAANDGSFEVN